MLDEDVGTGSIFHLTLLSLGELEKNQVSLSPPTIPVCNISLSRRKKFML